MPLEKRVGLHADGNQTREKKERKTIWGEIPPALALMSAGTPIYAHKGLHLKKSICILSAISRREVRLGSKRQALQIQA